MTENQVTVLMLRRDESDLREEEVTAVKNALGKEVIFKRTDPRDYLEHDAQCLELNAEMVMLPLDRPIPSKAMERGVPHVVVINDQLMQLLPLVPQFKPFGT